MTLDMYGIPNRHYGSEPDTERDEELVTQFALGVMLNKGYCPACLWGDGMLDAEWETHHVAHAETCTPLRERVADRMERDR